VFSDKVKNVLLFTHLLHLTLNSEITRVVLQKGRKQLMWCDRH